MQTLDPAARPSLRRVGNGAHPIVIVDDLGDPHAPAAIAAALAPFPPVAANMYPGARRIITERDTAAWAYVRQTLTAAAPYIAGGFDCAGFDLIEASFSIVTTPPGNLAPPQRAPHFDSVDPDYLAVMHYLSDTPGTAFFRQRATGVELVDADNAGRVVAAARTAAPDTHGYIAGSDAHYEQIGAVEGVAGRLVIYQGALLHSGIITGAVPLDPDPARGRLTANIFVRAGR